MSARRSLLALGVLAVLTVPTAALGIGAHGESWLDEGTSAPCPKYTTEAHFHTNDEAVTGAFVLASDGVHDLGDKIDVWQVLEAGSLALLASNIADIGVRAPNALADACYEPRHLQLEDELMKMTIQANLAATTTPDLSFVMPEKRPSGHVGPIPEEKAGFLDRKREGADNPNDLDDADIVGVRSTVRWTIDNMKDTGQCTCSLAEQSYSQAVSSMNSGQLKNAYKQFRQAYVYAFSN